MRTQPVVVALTRVLAAMLVLHTVSCSESAGDRKPGEAKRADERSPGTLIASFEPFGKDAKLMPPSATVIVQRTIRGEGPSEQMFATDFGFRMENLKPPQSGSFVIEAVVAGDTVVTGSLGEREVFSFSPSWVTGLSSAERDRGTSFKCGVELTKSERQQSSFTLTFTVRRGIGIQALRVWDHRK